MSAEEAQLSLPAPRLRGRAALPAQAVYVRDLEPKDLEALQREKGSQPPLIKRLRDSHHSVAKALALGMKPAQVSNLTGYSASRISILQADPAFQELLAFYRDNQSEEFLAQKAALDDRMLDTALDAVSIIQERLDEDPDEISTNQLVAITTAFADRTGFAPTAKSVSLNLSGSLSERLSAARKRVSAVSTHPNQGGDPSLPVPEPDGFIEGTADPLPSQVPCAPSTEGPPVAAPEPSASAPGPILSVNSEDQR